MKDISHVPLVIVLGYLFFAFAVAVSGPPGTFFVLIAIPFAAATILLVVGYLNRRNDPRHAKRPPDDP